MRMFSESGLSVPLVALVATISAPVGAFAQETAEARALWSNAAIADYEYSYQRACECHPDNLADTIVTVRDGAVVAVRYARDDYIEDIPVAPDRIAWFRTIEDLFALVDSATSAEAIVRVSFDAERGYPATVYVDYEPDLVGDEVDLRITSFRPLD